MNEFAKTGIFAGVAAVLAIAAALAVPSTRQADIYKEQGQPFFPSFTDPFKATVLEVVEYDDKLAVASAFKVEFKNNRWVIPSHNDYPADAKKRLAETSTSVIGLKKDAVRSDRAQDHASFGVVDPTDPGPETSGRGRRITLRDASGAVLADFIIGKETPGQPGHRFVRVPGERIVYASKMSIDLSTRFADWIETDLLNLDPEQITEITVNDHSIEETPEGLALVPGEKTVLKKTPDLKWSIDGLAETEEVNAATVGTMTSALDDLKIVGVRRKPAGLAADLRSNTDPTARAAVKRALSEVGFFFNGDEICSKDGELQIACDDGVVYILRFGFAYTGSGSELESGIEEKDKKPPKEGETAPAGTEVRFLMITAKFDPKILPEPELPPVPASPYRIDVESWSEDRMEAEEKKRVKAYEAAVERRAEEGKRLAKERETKVEAGKKRAKALTDRFADWYYVIGAGAYGKVHVSKKDLVKGKGEPQGPKMPGDEEHDHDHEEPH